MNETATKTSSNTIFQSLRGGGGPCGTNRPTKVVNLTFFYTFHPKKDTKDGF